MKWVRFQDSDGIFYGIQEGDSVQKTILTWDDILAGRSADGGQSVALSSVKVLAPVARPSKIVAVGQNYMDHCREQNVAPPTRPILFTKFTTSIIGTGDTIEFSESLTQQADYEVELAVVIGKEARKVSEEDALDHVFGYTVVNDVSARDLQYSDKQWVRAKSLDTFCPMGPCVVTANEIADPQALKLRTTLNDTIMQDSTTAEMIFDVRHLISFCSQAFTLLPGDVILTGTPDGVGKFREPPIFLKDGDTVTCEVEGIGQISNPVRVI
ncbi:MAG: fumarylacetoacetate hydrolase family protein [Anaerolineae bacterium]|nr:fumarylacetoacetate hydrolase family protein [Anaerolineae bacterium]